MAAGQEETRPHGRADPCLSALLAAVPDALLALDAAGRVLDANRVAEDVFGLPRASLLGRDLAELVPSGGEAGPGGPLRTDRLARRADGATFPVELTVARAELPGPVAALAHVRDVGDQRRADEAVRDLLAQQAALRRVATAVVGTADAAGVFDLVTREVGTLLGAETANMIRFNGDETARVVGVWSSGDARNVALGSTVALDGDTVSARVWRTGRPARVDSYQGLGGSLAEHLRELGFRAAVGAPIVLHGRLWGAVLVSSHDAPFPPDAEQRVGDFAELAAHALAHAQAREDLAASRARIVEAADAERRRLERNLHDGAQQRLVSLALTLRVAALKLPEESEARALVERAGEDLAEALAELREFARGVHPAVLTERGLAAALESLAARAPLPVQLEVRIAGRLPEQVEAALYYVAAEGLTNAARYARARSVSIAVTGSDDHAEIEVGDDGIGGASQESGSGLRGLCDRVEAFGGRLRLHSPPGGGTALSARIPLRVSSPRSPSDPASAPA